MSNDTPRAMQKTQPVRNMQLILMAVGVVATALQAVNWADHPSWQSVAGTVVSALFTAFSGYLSKWLPGLVVPLRDTAVYVDQNGNSVAGPAAPIPDGQPAQAVQVDGPSAL